MAAALRWLLLAALFLPASAVLGTEPLKFTVVGVDCEACAPPILKALKSVPGVRDARLDWKAAVATVDVPEGLDREKLRAAVKDIGYETVFAGEVREERFF